MNWDRAKTMLIICLLGLNAFLAAMYFVYEDDYVTSSEDIEVVIDILSANGILLDQLYVDVPRRYEPVDQIVLQPAEYSTAQLLEAFFTDTSGISQTFEFGNTIFTSPEGTLTIMRHIVRFEPSQHVPGVMGAALEGDPIFPLTSPPPLFERFVRDNAHLFPNFEFDVIHRENGYDYVIEFRQNHMGYTILSNMLRFTVGPYGVTEVLYVYYPPVEFVGVVQPIISAPQALFMFKLGNAHIDKPITVTRIDLVQNLVFSADGSGRITTAPYYRVFSDRGEPMLINAITGDIQ
ncbi:MAG: hypothetical protein FWE20_06055 [Defluviitaleaceae bacterium]|nr:hypothetical protein [Defluviitaleaceae bacterium]